MSTRERRLDRGRRLSRRTLLAIGEELREARIQAGLTQRELGAPVGISASEISRIEHGQSPHVAYETLAAWARLSGSTFRCAPIRTATPFATRPNLPCSRGFEPYCPRVSGIAPKFRWGFW
jgi:DNA-binding XRE family transcriptional regulator